MFIVLDTFLCGNVSPLDLKLVIDALVGLWATIIHLGFKGVLLAGVLCDKEWRVWIQVVGIHTFLVSISADVESAAVEGPGS